MSVGAQLKRARSERKLSLADISRETKIQPWVLEALEGDRLQELMSPIYVKGFLASYARFLALEPEPLVATLSWPQAPTEQQPLPPPTRTWPTIQWRAPVRRLVSALALGAVVAVVTVAHPGRPVKHQHTASRPVRTQPTKPALASVAPIREPEPAPPALPTLTLLATQPLQLSLDAQRTTWIEVRADGKLLSQQRLQRGAKERWIAQKQFEVIVSQPSYVELSLNGQSISPFVVGHRGRLLITHRGVTALPDHARSRTPRWGGSSSGTASHRESHQPRVPANACRFRALPRPPGGRGFSAR